MNKSETLHCIAVVKRENEKSSIHFTNSENKQVSIEVEAEADSFFQTGKDYRIDSVITEIVPLSASKNDDDISDSSRQLSDPIIEAGLE
jgi:K+-transporting ATPase c subunit